MGSAASSARVADSGKGQSHGPPNIDTALPRQVPEYTTHSPQPSQALDARQAREAAAAKNKQDRNARVSVPVTKRDHRAVESRPPPPVWDPRSPTAARTPKREIRAIRASVVIQEQVSSIGR